jgi:Zn-dependent protease
MPIDLNWHLAALNVLIFWMLTTPHEFAHAWVATRLGDDTPEREGRVTLNPMAHVDWIGTVLLPAITSMMGAGFLGWGKPVNTNPARLKWHREGLLMVALAGPLSNIAFALLLSALAVFVPSAGSLAVDAARMSIYLALFNLLPVPPLDGSKIWLVVPGLERVYDESGRFGFIALILLFSTTRFGSWLSQTADAFVWSFVSMFR